MLNTTSGAQKYVLGDLIISINCIVLKGTNGRQKTYEIFHVYCIFYSGFMCQTTVIFWYNERWKPWIL